MNLASVAILRRGFALASLAPAVLALIFAGTPAALAQDADTPPSLVGRVAGIEGQVSMHRGDQQDWAQAEPNEPITVGDAVYANVGGEARLEVGGARLMLKSDSELDIAALDQDSGRMRLDTGVLDVRVDALPTQDGLYILTPRGTVRLTRQGSYRIEAGTEDQPTRVTSWNGEAQVGDSGGAVAVQPGQTLLISGTPDAPQYSYDRDIGPTPEDVRPRPPQLVARTRSYVPPDMTGAEDLGDYGDWQEAPDYGAVWYPSSVPVDWEPYHYGHWAFVAPWGWTWIDDQPWGFAPFHYGRWAFIGGRWGWCPGRYEEHPVYAPALVAFIGGGGLAASISIGFGGGEPVGWVPLAPGEFYRPAYRVNNTYIQNINRTVIVNNNITNNNVTINRNVIDQGPGSVANLANRRFATVVPASAMGGRQPIAKAAVAVQPAVLEHAQVGPQVAAAIPHPPQAVARPGQPGPAFAPGAPKAAFASRPILPPAGRAPGAPIPQTATPAVVHPTAPQQPGFGRPAPVTPPPQVARPGAPLNPAAPQQPGFGRPAPVTPPPQVARPGAPFNPPTSGPNQGAMPQQHTQGFRTAAPPPPPPPRQGVVNGPPRPALNQSAPPPAHQGFQTPPAPAISRPTPPPPRPEATAPRQSFAPAPHPAPSPQPAPAPAYHPAPAPAYHPAPQPAYHPAPAPAYHPAPAPAYHPAPAQAFHPAPQPAPHPAPAPMARPAPAPAPAPHPAPPPNNQKKDEHH